MGEYAEYSLLSAMRRGLPFNPNWVQRKRPRCSCVECRKEVEASEGLAAHTKEKHPDALPRLLLKFGRLAGYTSSDSGTSKGTSDD